MAHDFANAYGNVKVAVNGLIASDPLRASLNRASAQFKMIDDDDFDKAPLLRAEFRALRNRLRRNIKHRGMTSTRSLDSTNSDDLISLAEDILNFFEKMGSVEYKEIITLELTLPGSLIQDPGPGGRDEDCSLD